MQMALPKVVTFIYVPRKSSNPKFASNLTKALPLFWGANYSLSFFEREFHVQAGFFFGGNGGE